MMVPRHFESSKTFYGFLTTWFLEQFLFFFLNFRANVDRDGTSAF